MECTDGTHTCQQVCINTHGGFRCTCYTGFTLNGDGFNCSGKYSTLNNHMDYPLTIIDDPIY